MSQSISYFHLFPLHEKLFFSFLAFHLIIRVEKKTKQFEVKGKMRDDEARQREDSVATLA